MPLRFCLSVVPAVLLWGTPTVLMRSHCPPSGQPEQGAGTRLCAGFLPYGMHCGHWLQSAESCRQVAYAHGAAR